MSIPKLYPEKQLILSKINQFYLSNNSGYLCVPTGWGKTFLSKHLIQQYLNIGKNVLFIVSQNNQLLTQTAFSNQQRVFPNSIILSSVHDTTNVKALKQQLKPAIGYVIFASLQTILSLKNTKIKELLYKKINLFIIDEIHNFIKNKGTDFIRGIPATCHIFGMTATPIQGILGNTKHVTDICDGMKEIHAEYLLDCINKGILSKINYTIIHSKQSVVDIFDFTRGLQELTKQELIMDCSTMRKIQAAIKRTKLAKKVYDTKVNPMSKTLVFCSPTQNLKDQKIVSFHAKLSALIFNNEIFIPNLQFSNYSFSGKFKRAVFLTSDMPKDEQQAILNDFRDLSKPPYILCTVGMLIEGFNFPDLQNLILLRPTLSMRLFEQQVGRVLRKPEQSQKEWGNIYEVVDNIDPLYQLFKGQVFSQNIAEQLQLLQPHIRIERLLFGNKNQLSCNDMSRVKIVEISDFDMNSILVKNTATNQQIEHLEKMINMLDDIKEGSLRQESFVLQDICARIKMYTADDIFRVLRLIKRLNSMSNANCSTQDKSELLRRLSWLLKLNITCVIERLKLLPVDRIKILLELGCSNELSEFKKKCFLQGTGKNIDMVTDVLSQPCKNNALAKKWYKICQRFYGNWLQFI